MTVRVRFAPSPTGLFHVGGARSALQNWLFAKQHDGVFVLRIEDTDAARNRPEWTEGILSALDWIGISRGTYEGPHFQSSYADAAEGRSHSALRGWPGVLLRLHARADPGAHRQQILRLRRLSTATAASPPGDGHALRFRTPDEGVTKVVDLIRGEPTFENALLEDFVIARGDGSPTFLLANAVDDMSMGITHVIRAEEHLPNTPKQQLLWEALGATPPIWAHVPVVVNEKRQKLSKRRDKVSLEQFRDEGYLADAMRNYLMLLGWAPSGDREIVPWSVIEQEFRLEDVNLSSAFFDEKKLRAFNGDYIRALSPEAFVDACQPWLIGTETIPAPPWPAEAFDPKVFAAVAPLAQTRIALLAEIVPNVDFMFLDTPDFDEAAWAKTMKDGADDMLAATHAGFAGLFNWDAETLKATVEEIGAARGLKLGKAQAPIRVAVTGRTVGLPLFESLELLGRDRTLDRIAAARERIRLSV